MKAAIYEKYGPADVVEIREIERPAIGEKDVLVEVAATTVTTGDWRLRASAFPGVFLLVGRLMFGLFRPRNRVLGMEFAGKVVSAGPGVTRFAVGDEVFGFASRGAHAEYLAISEDAAIARKPANIGFAEAAATPFGAISALVFLRDFAGIRPGQKVLVLGASGGVGVHVVQLAKHFGAEVTGVTSTTNLDLVRSLGADHVIDYRKEDYTAGSEAYDLIFDTAGTTTFAQAKRVLKPTGIFLPLEFSPREIMQALLTTMSKGKRVVIGVNDDGREDLDFIGGLLACGAIRPVIDGAYSLEQIADAYRRVESRHKTGSVVVTLDRQAASLRAVA